ncbi:MAG: 3-methyl-2-oxobutanoate dehydrogenase subunit VorB [Christensenellales bacterium]|jgi:2-oxoglutarate ferredoxin oxidoreductase subunit alpha
MEKILMKGNEAIAEAAIMAGCRQYFGYPITPQNQIPEYMSKRMPQVGGTFLQSESEVAAINMVYGAAGAGGRVMTSSSSPGISLKQEGISYIVGAELPCVIVNIVRGGPGLGGIQPAQSDYNQSTRGGGHGDYRMIVLAPSSVQEAIELTQDAFDLADIYRNPVMVMGDGMIGQMMEPVVIKEREPVALPDKAWAATGWDGKTRPRAVINSLFIDPEVLEKHNLKLQAKYAAIEKEQVRVEVDCPEDSEYIIVAYGTVARITSKAVAMARAEGMKVGLIRPITLWPFPKDAIKNAVTDKVKHVMTVELAAGQMLDDVRIAIGNGVPSSCFYRLGGMVPTSREVFNNIMKLKGGK